MDLELSLLKSGWNKNDNPSAAPGAKSENIVKTINIAKSTGMKILENFSIPFCTPMTMEMWHIMINKTIRGMIKLGTYEGYVSEQRLASGIEDLQIFYISDTLAEYRRIGK